MNWIRLVSAVVVVIAAVPQCVVTANYAIARPPTIDELFERLGYSEADKKAILAGEIISTDVERTRDDQLFAAVGLPIKASIPRLAATLEDGSNISLNTATLAWGEVKSTSLLDFKDVAYGGEELQEVRYLLQVGANSSFNFSGPELEFLEEQLKDFEAEDPASAEAVAAAYRKVLAGRAKAYSEKGLDGVAAYERGGRRLTPAKQLRAVEAQAGAFLSTYFPKFWKALEGFPRNPDPTISSNIYWAKRSVEGRPAFLLIHQMVQAGDDFVLTSQRQFYVGHTYESLQMIGLALPAEEGAMIFSVNSVFTDQITGFFSGVAQSVGQGRTREDMAKHFEAVRRKIR